MPGAVHVCMVFKIGLYLKHCTSYTTIYLTHLALTTDMPGIRFRLSVHRKNEERKKHVSKALPVSIKLTKEVMVFQVSIPLAVLKFVVSIPLSIFLSTPIVSLHALQTRLQAALPPSWIIAETAMDSLVLCKLRYQPSQSVADVLFTVTINPHLWCRIMLCGNYLDPSKHEFVSSLPSRICSYIDIICILVSLDACRICIGNNKEKFLSVVRHRNSTPKGECFDATIIY